MEICPEKISISQDGHPLAIPACWNYPLDIRNEKITHAVIVIHGVLRNAETYYPNMMAAAIAADHAETHTIIIAPQFLVEEDFDTFELEDHILFWGGETGEGWKRGDASLSTPAHTRPAQVSSFTIIDHIVVKLADQAVFPNLKQIMVAGHSAGGQFVNRYAAGTQVFKQLPASCRLRFMVANPSSYLYFDGKRRVPGTNNRFEYPQDEVLAEYNEYKYGLEKLNPYMAALGKEEIFNQYPSREVVYLLGGDDNNLEDPHLEKSAPANLQGEHRLARGQVYENYLHHTFGIEIAQNHQFYIIPGVGHDHAGIFISKPGQQVLFK